MRTTNHFDPSERLSASDDNQFLLAPSRLEHSPGKDELIKKLEQKNQRLMTEIQKIQRVLNEPEIKPQYGNRLPELKSKVTQQELQNAYKQIKTYEYEIKKLRSIGKDGSYAEQIKRLENIYKQKQEMSARLRKQIADAKKESIEITKSLTNDNIKEQYETRNTKLHSELKWLNEKAKQLQMKKSMNNANREKQLSFIKKIQNQLIQQGFPVGTVRALRQKYAPQKQNPNQSYYSGRRSTALRTSYAAENRTHISEQDQKQVIEDRTPQAFVSLQNEIKLLRKMEKDYQNQAANQQKQKQDAANINLTSRNRLIEIQDEIQSIQNKLVLLKKMIDPAKIKPTKGLSVPNTTRYGSSGKNISLKGSFQHLFRNEQVGKVSKEGKPFTDRAKLGKNKAKIIAVDCYELKQTGTMMGLQVTYQINQSVKKGPVNMYVEQNEKIGKKTVYLIDSEDYYKIIQCICNERGLIIGLALMSNKGIAAKVGNLQGSRKPINVGNNQYPTCLYGSIREDGFQLLGVEVTDQKNG